MVRRDAQILQKSAKACQSTLAKLKITRTRLMSETEGSIGQIFENAAVSFDAKASQHGFERALELTQQEVGRKTEARIELLNQSIQQVAKECSAEASAYLSLVHEKPTINVGSDEPTPAKDRDLLANLLSDPVNQVGFMVLAPVAAFVFGWVGLAVVAFPFVARLFGGSQPKPTTNVQAALHDTGNQLKNRVTTALAERLDAIEFAITDVLDEPQHRIRSTCKALSGDDGESRLDERWQRRVDMLIADCAALRQSTAAEQLLKTALVTGK
jgi:hypothetical protein